MVDQTVKSEPTQRLTFFTSANGAYECFVLPYIASALYFNDDARVEICLERPKEFEHKNADGLSILQEFFGDRFLLRRATFKGRTPGLPRFIEEPRVKTEYTYIGDIDILILESIFDSHAENMKQTGLPYSNVLRARSTSRMSGLHFTRSDAYYPLTLPQDFDPAKYQDEIWLAQIIRARGLPLPSPEATFRPTHGFHMSWNRMPTPTLGWDLEESRVAPYQKLKNSQVWTELLPLFQHDYKILLLLLDTALHALFRDKFRLRSRQTIRGDLYAHSTSPTG